MQSQELLLRKISACRLLARGCLSIVARTKGGKAFYSLQYRRNTRHFVKYVPSDEVGLYEKATSEFAELKRLFERYVDDMSKMTMREIAKEAKRCKDRK